MNSLGEGFTWKDWGVGGNSGPPMSLHFHQIYPVIKDDTWC